MVIRSRLTFFTLKRTYFISQKYYCSYDITLAFVLKYSIIGKILKHFINLDLTYVWAGCEHCNQCCQLNEFVAISGDFPDPLGDFISKKRLATNLATFFCHCYWIIVSTKHWKSISHIPFCSSHYNRSHESWVQWGLSSSPLHSHSACAASLTR